MYNFNNKVVLINGGTSGIGEKTALAFASSGATVIISGRNTHKGNAVSEQLQQINPTCKYISCDVSDPDAVNFLHQQVIEEYQEIHIAFNNFGYLSQAMSLRQLDTSEMNKIIDINLKGLLYCHKEQLSNMSKQGHGVIINTSSASAYINPINYALYAACKGAVINITKATAKEYAIKNIRANAILPGTIDTPMLSDVEESVRESTIARIPMQRLGEPEEVANLALWLSSEQASYVTGQAICVDGGRTVV